MTTKAAADLYLAQHLYSVEGKGYAIYNPNNKPITKLPVIYGFNNGGSTGWYTAVLLAEDGTGLGSHCCSHEGYMTNDLGILEGTKPDRHKTFKKHYPNGYRMDFVSGDKVKEHKELNIAFELNQKLAKESKKKDD